MLAFAELKGCREDVYKRQVNERLTSDMNSVKLDIQGIKMERATEKYAMDGMRKYYPYVVVLALVMAPAITAFITSITRMAKGIGG